MSDDTQQAERPTDDDTASADTAGVEAAGFESSNNSRDETEAIMNAESPEDVDDSLLEQIESERKERLAPENRPDNAEVDNTQRTFNAETARFEDSDVPADEADDGIGQKEPDPETQAGSSDDRADGTDTGEDTHESEAATPASPGKHKA